MKVAIALFAFVFTVAAAPIQSVLPCGTPGAAGGLGAGTDMQRFTIDTRLFADARCNDGSPAVFYFAPGTESTKWVIFLQGGGACRDGQTCAERWCSANTNFGMDKMTSTLSRTSIRIGGLLDPGAHNRYSTWNRVLIYYCSSDSWAGTKSATLTAEGGNRTVEYDIHFGGARIVDAVIATLRKDFGKRRSVSAQGSAIDVPWPDLDTATHVLFAGSSAGGAGAIHNGDRVGQVLRAENSRLVQYGVLVDATYNPDYEFLDFSHFCDGCTYEQFFTTQWQTWNVSTVGTRVDASCLDRHTGDGSEWRCADDGHVLTHHMTEPLFIRQDLQDSLLSGNFSENGFGTRVEYGALVHEELTNLPVPEEPRAAEPGMFLPQCTDHEAVTSDRAVFNVKVNGLSFHDLVWNWWSGAMPRQAIRNFTGSAGAAPECP